MSLEFREVHAGGLIELMFRQLPTSTSKRCEWFRDPDHERADWLVRQRSILGVTAAPSYVNYVCHEHAAELFEHYAGLVS